MLTRYGYDAAGQERTQTVIDGSTPVTTLLDAQGRATAIGENAGGTGPFTSTFGYNANDLPTAETLPGGSGVHVALGYDPDSRLTSLSATGPTGVAHPLTNSYSYGYNAIGWTTQGISSIANISGTETITHDALGRITAQSGGPDAPVGGAEQWLYDANGNITTTHEPMAGMTQNVTTVMTYSASTPNELLSAHTDGLGTEYRAYDQNGDTTAITSTDPLSSQYALDTHLSYDAQSRPLTITVRDHDSSIPTSTVVLATVTFAYNAQGQRSAYTSTTPGYPALSYSAHFQYRNGELGQASVVSGTAGGSISYTDTYIYDQSGAPLELLRQQGGTTSRYWYVLDGHGSVVAVTDNTGNVMDRYTYDLWGEPTAVSESVPQQLRYAGYWYDNKLAWYWVSVRSYDPEGRWLQPDPSQQDGVRTYVYVGDDPVDATDPTGLGDGIGGPSITNGIVDLFVVGAAAVVAIAASPEILAGAALVGGSVLIVGGVRYVVTAVSVNASGLPPCASSPPPGFNPIQGPTRPLGETTVGLATCNPHAQPIVLLASAASADAAAGLGYNRRVRGAPFDSHGQPVYTNGRDYITPDVDSHRGGVWKKFDRRGNRQGTYDAKLNRIGD